MHFALLMITEERPTEEVLSKAFVQFGPHGEGGERRWVAKFDALMNDVPAESWISVIEYHY